jgi:hypothetical protein
MTTDTEPTYADWVLHEAILGTTAGRATKSADGLVRLVEFASGRPDSRSEAGTDWLRTLTNEQFAIVSG